MHFTWFVNSAAHMFGDHPYDGKSWPSENPFVSICAIGEGWHNWCVECFKICYEILYSGL